jgi:hypothetical protein
MTRLEERCRVVFTGLFVFLLGMWPARAVIRDGGIDPANLGKGEWIYFVQNATNKMGGNVPTVTNEASLMSHYTNMGVRYVIVKAGTGSAEFNGNYAFPQFNANLIAKAHAVGLLIFGYTRSYGTDVPGEIALATTVFNKGADGFVLDAESEWESDVLPNNVTKAVQLCSGIRSNWPTKFMAHAPYPIVSYHSTFPYKEFGYYCDATMPQYYYSGWSGVKGRPSGAINWADVEIKAWQNSLTGQWTNSIKPIVPVTTVYGPTSGSQMSDESIMEFIDYLNADANSPTVGGYQGVNFWEGYLTGSNQWANIKKSTVGSFPGIVRNIVLDSAIATTVGAWTSTRTFYDGTFYGNGSGTDTNSFGTNYLTIAQGGGSAYVQFTPNILVAGDYDVYQWHPFLTTASASVPHIINFSGGSTTVYANQTTNAGKWSLLGRFNFAAGAGGNIRVADNVAGATKVAIADGVKLIYAGTNVPGPLPAAPSGLTATAVSSSQINLTWTDNATNETGFVVARSTVSGGTYTDVAWLAANATGYSNTGLSSDTPYYFVLRATNSFGSSANSAEAGATTLPAAAGPSSPATQPNGQLAGRIIYATGGHGWVWTGSGWDTQRGVGLEMCEDYGNLDQLNFFVPYLFNSGATVAACGRPFGNQTNEVVLSHTNASSVAFSGAWSVNTTDAVYFRGSAGDRFRYATLNATETATATYTPNIPVAGFYPVYTWVPHGADRGNQLYHILHTGGEMQVRVPHHMVGRGWVYLGTYFFNAGANTNGAVVISNLRGTADGTYAIADGMRFGNGMGSIDRGGGVSDYPREEECCRYWVQNSLGTGQSSSIYDFSSDDGSDSVTAGTRMAAEMNREASGTIFKRIFLSFHSNSSGGTARGNVALYNNTSLFPGTATPNQQAYAGIVGTNVHWALKSMTVPPYEILWTNIFASPYTYYSSSYAYGEINNSFGINSEFDATILEVAFHDNVPDTLTLRDPKARNLVGRASYHAVVRYMNAKDTVDPVSLTFLPEPVSNVRAIATANGITLSWTAPGSVIGSGAPTNYVIYRSSNGYGFGNPVSIGGTSTSITLTNLPAETDFYFRVAAVNIGGESLPSEVVGCRRASAGAARVLYVRGFDRFDRTTNLRQTPTAENYVPPGGSGTMDRVIARANNSFDYVVQHGKAVSAAGWAFDSCARAAVASGQVTLGSYAVVIWGAGQETNNVITSAEQNLLKSYLTNNGSLFISGADVAWGLGRASGPSASDRSFLTDQLHCTFPSDANHNSGSYTFNAAGGGIFAGNASGLFDDGSEGIYWVQKPDVLTPTGNGAQLAMTYGSGTGAAIQYDGSAGGGRVVYLGFPFETITSAAVREAYMADALNFLAVPTAPVITAQPQSQTVAVDDNATFTVTASGAPTLGYQWWFNNAILAGATSSSYTRVNAQLVHAGDYSVVVSNHLGSVTSAVAVLTVSTNGIPPNILTPPQSQTVATGDNATFTVTANGTEPLRYQWRFNGENLANATGTSYTRFNAQESHAGSYAVVVTNNAGAVTSAPATLTVIGVCVPGTLANAGFEAGNVSGVADGWTAYEVNSPTMKVWSIQTASPPEGLQYQQIQAYDDTHAASAGVRQNITGCVVGATYTISGWYRSNSDNGRARVRVSPSASTDWNTAQDLNPVADYGSGTTWAAFSGTVVATATSMTIWLDGRTIAGTSAKVGCFDSIIVTCLTPPSNPPGIAQQPSDQNVAAGGTANFTIVASGTSPLSYQWQKSFSLQPLAFSPLTNGGHYSGVTTDTLTITGADSNDVASYRCAVTNAYGVTNSSAAALTLITPNACLGILNSDFESGFSLAGGGYIGNGWTEWEATTGVIIGYDETSIVHGGAHSQRIRISSPGANSGGVYQRVPATPGSAYSVSVWMYADDALTVCSLGVDPAGGTDPNSGVTWSSGSSSAAWVQKTWTGNATANYLTVYYRVSSPDNVKRNGYFDDGTPGASSGSLQLQAAGTGNALTLIWPECPNSRLEQAGSLTAPANWTTVTNQVSVIAGHKSVTLTPTESAAFFRLAAE